MSFVEAGVKNSGSSERWVEFKDDVSASLLHARVLERKLPVRVTVI